MSQRSAIEWTDATWNPVTGCSEVSPGCDHCYARTFAERFAGVPGHYFEQGFAVQLRPDKLGLPHRWRQPRRIFVNSMSDLFHAQVPDDYIARVFAVMAATPHHTYQVLTKRHGRMRSLLGSASFPRAVASHLKGPRRLAWPLPNVWLGVSVEDQPRARLRVPALVAAPAAVRFLSCEPLLGPVDLTAWLPGVNWVIAGGESGRGARPMAPGWPRALRDQCVDSGVAFLFKQWGEHTPAGDGLFGDAMRRVGKHRAGRVLDGRTWDQYPDVPPAGVQVSGVQRGASVGVHPASCTPGVVRADRHRVGHGALSGGGARGGSVHVDHADAGGVQPQARPGQHDAHSAAQATAQPRPADTSGTQPDGVPTQNGNPRDTTEHQNTSRQHHPTINHPITSTTTEQNSSTTSNQTPPPPPVILTATDSKNPAEPLTRSRRPHPCIPINWGCAAASGGRCHLTTPTPTVDLVTGVARADGGWLWC